MILPEEIRMEALKMAAARYPVDAAGLTAPRTAKDIVEDARVFADFVIGVRDDLQPGTTD